MDLVEKFHTKDHFEVIHGHDGEIKFFALCPKSYTHTLCGARNGLSMWVHRLYGASFLHHFEALLSEIKLYVVPVSSNAHMTWLLMDALTYVNLFFVGVVKCTEALESTHCHEPPKFATNGEADFACMGMFSKSSPNNGMRLEVRCG